VRNSTPAVAFWRGVENVGVGGRCAGPGALVEVEVLLDLGLRRPSAGSLIGT